MCSLTPCVGLPPRDQASRWRTGKWPRGLTTDTLLIITKCHSPVLDICIPQSGLGPETTEPSCWVSTLSLRLPVFMLEWTVRNHFPHSPEAWSCLWEAWAGNCGDGSPWIPEPAALSAEMNKHLIIDLSFHLPAQWFQMMFCFVFFHLLFLN